MQVWWQHWSFWNLCQTYLTHQPWRTWRGPARGRRFCNLMFWRVPFPLFHPPTHSYGQMVCTLSQRLSIPHIYVMLRLVHDGISEKRDKWELNLLSLPVRIVSDGTLKSSEVCVVSRLWLLTLQTPLRDFSVESESPFTSPCTLNNPCLTYVCFFTV